MLTRVFGFCIYLLLVFLFVSIHWSSSAMISKRSFQITLIIIRIWHLIRKHNANYFVYEYEMLIRISKRYRHPNHSNWLNVFAFDSWLTNERGRKWKHLIFGYLTFFILYINAALNDSGGFGFIIGHSKCVSLALNTLFNRYN